MAAGLLGGCRRGVPLGVDRVREWDMVAAPLARTRRQVPVAWMAFAGATCGGRPRWAPPRCPHSFGARPDAAPPRPAVTDAAPEWDVVEASRGGWRRAVPLAADGVRRWDMVAGLRGGCRHGVPLGVDGVRGWDVVARVPDGCCHGVPLGTDGIRGRARWRVYSLEPDAMSRRHRCCAEWDVLEASSGGWRRVVPLAADGVRRWDTVAGLLGGCRRVVPLATDGIREWDMAAALLARTRRHVPPSPVLR